MPQKCIVPLCKGNYDNGPKVSVFGFPRRDDLKVKWLNAIPRKNFQPTRNSKVCELHFREDDFRRVAEHYDEKTGRKLVVKLTQLLLKEDAIPSIFPGSPSYLSSISSLPRPSPEEPIIKKERTEYTHLETAISKRLQEQIDYEKMFRFRSLDELLLSLQNVKIPEIFTLARSSESVSFLYLEVEPIPAVVFSVVVCKDLEVRAYFRNVALTKLNNYKLPFKTDDVNTLCLFLNEITNLKMEPPKNASLQNMLNLMQDMLHKLEEIIPEDKLNVIRFVSEQLSLLNCQKYNHTYSPEFLNLAALMLSISPRAYNFLRHSGYLTLPHPGTLWRQCSTYNADPRFQLHEETQVFTNEK